MGKTRDSRSKYADTGVVRYLRHGKAGKYTYPVGIVMGGLEILAHGEIATQPYMNTYAVHYLGCGCTGIVQEQHLRTKERRGCKAAKCNICAARDNAKRTQGIKRKRRQEALAAAAGIELLTTQQAEELEAMHKQEEIAKQAAFLAIQFDIAAGKLWPPVPATQRGWDAWQFAK